MNEVIECVVLSNNQMNEGINFKNILDAEGKIDEILFDRWVKFNLDEWKQGLKSMFKLVTLEDIKSEKWELVIMAGIRQVSNETER